MVTGTVTEKFTGQNTRSGIWGAPFVLAMLVAVVVIGLTWIAQGFLWNYALEEEAQDRLAAMDRNSTLIEARLRGRANDMFFLKRVAEAEIARNPNASPASENLQSAITTMMLARSQYDQIRLLNLTGQEMFRYNWKGGERPLEEVSPNALQDKSDRPYYRETLAASPEAAVFSPLDLNVENGKIEKPIKPVVRVSGQIVGPDGRPRALLVLNYLGDQLLREVKQDKSKPREYMLLNADGYWLVGPEPDGQWGFMYPDRKGATLKEENPALWTQITSATSGWFEKGGDLYCFQHIDPVGSTADYPPLRMSIAGGERLKWTLLAREPRDVVWGSVRGIRRGIWATCAIALAVLVPLVWSGGVSLERRRRDMREVREARTMLDSVIEVSPHGITVMEAVRDEQGGIADLQLVFSNKKALEVMGQDLPAGKQEGRSMRKDYPESLKSGSYAAFLQRDRNGEAGGVRGELQHQKCPEVAFVSRGQTRRRRGRDRG